MILFLHSVDRISLARASGERFRRRVFDALGGTGDACFLGELFCRRPGLPGPTPPARRAPRPDVPVVCPGSGIDRFSKRTAAGWLKDVPSLASLLPAA